MFRLIPLAFVLLCSTGAALSQYSLSVAEYATEIVPGQTTYRIYVDVINDDDFVSSVYGNDEAPLNFSTVDGFYNDPLGASFASGIIAGFIPFFPTMAADSWLTIGIESQNQGDEVAINAVEDPLQPFVGTFQSGSPIDGADFTIDTQAGGVWYVLNNTPNGLPDENLQVLVMQFSTTGGFDGLFNFQVFVNGVGSTDVRKTIAFDGVGTFYADGEGPVGPVSGCTDVWACNYDAAAETDDGSCEYLTCLGCTDEEACNYDPDAVYNDGSCEYTSCAAAGCTNVNACNYDPEATVDDGTCEFTSCAGCTDVEADNYDPTATVDDGSCEYGGCLNPLACNYDPMANTSDGSCEYESCIGCLNPSACNFDPTVTTYDPTSCEYPDPGYTCDGTCIDDADGDGVCDEYEVPGCTDATANNFDANATDDDGSCTYDVMGCLNPFACNYNPLATVSDGSCDFTSCAGCMDEAACDYDPEATISTACLYTDECGVCGGSGIPEGACNCDGEVPSSGYDCDGNCLADADDDGVCDEFEVVGCTDAEACDYNAAATDAGDCQYAASGYDCSGACLNDADGDGVCDEFEVAGCTDSTACSYNEAATDEDGSCAYGDFGYDCDGDCLSDVDGDGICDPFEVEGCLNPLACNYNADATDANNALCDFFSCTGCTDAAACNYDPEAAYENGSCTYPEDGFDCDGNCLGAWVDGECCTTTTAGCTDPAACNYAGDSGCMVNDGSCEYASPVKTVRAIVWKMPTETVYVTATKFWVACTLLPAITTLRPRTTTVRACLPRLATIARAPVCSMPTAMAFVISGRKRAAGQQRLQLRPRRDGCGLLLLRGRRL